MRRPLLIAGVVMALGEAAGLLYMSGNPAFIPVIILAVIMICIFGSSLCNIKCRNRLLLFLCALSLMIGVIWGLYGGRKVEPQPEVKEVKVLSAYRRDSGRVLITAKTGGYKILIISEYEGDISPGMYINARGTPSELSESTNPGGYSEKSSYGSKGYKYKLEDAEVEAASGRKDLLLYALGRVSYCMSTGYDRVTDEETAGVLKAMILGDRSDIDTEIRDIYQQSGVIHILVVSGLHVSLITSAVIKLLSLLGLSKRKAALGGIAAAIIYGLMTGMAASTMRAVIMSVIVSLGTCLGRTPDPPTSMAFALIILMIVQPDLITSTGLLLSFAAVGGVTAGGYISEDIDMDRTLRRFPPAVRKGVPGMLRTIVVSLSVNAFMVPVLICSNYQVPLYGMLLNFIIIPLLTAAVISGALGGAAGSILVMLESGRISGGAISAAGALSKLLIIPAEYILRFYRWLCTLSLGLPGSRIVTGHISVPGVMIYYVILLGALILIRRMREDSKDDSIRKKALALNAVFLSLSMVLFLAAVFFLNRGTSAAVFLDVGQGDGCIIMDKDITITVDGGSTSTDSAGRYVIVPALKFYGRKDIDIAFISHTDEDHINGIRYILENPLLTGVHIKRIVFAYGTDPEDQALTLMTGLAERCGTEVIFMRAGDEMLAGDVRVKAIYPSGNELLDHTGNDYSLVIRTDMPGRSILFTGDISSEAEEAILEMYGEGSGGGEDILKADILKVPHHGSRYSSSEMFLRAVGMDTAVISAGKKNRYGHPASDALERLSDAGCEIYRTDQDGAVIYSRE